MAIIKRCFSFTTGTLFGAYIAQNYSVPNVGKLFGFFFGTAKQSKSRAENLQE
ncbi:hypothetical protein ACJIZ3_007850 [Penstemon smallii]|uniref:Uncharacterized protein n=1 Tax=Penstemon smallii TaxID=265156 RepID=A0ABD3T840_9LAMI